MADRRTIDDYIAGLPDWRGEAVARLRGLIREAGPELTEGVKWAQPVWSVGGPAIYVKAFGGSVNLGFWRGGELEDPEGRLEGGDRMKHLKLRSVGDIDADAVRTFVRQAVALNRERGDPTKRG